ELALERMRLPAHRGGSGEQAREGKQAGQRQGADARARSLRAGCRPIPFGMLRRCHRDPPLSVVTSRWPLPATTWAAARSASAAPSTTPNERDSDMLPPPCAGRVVGTMLAKRDRLTEQSLQVGSRWVTHLLGRALRWGGPNEQPRVGEGKEDVRRSPPPAVGGRRWEGSLPRRYHARIRHGRTYREWRERALVDALSGHDLELGRDGVLLPRFGLCGQGARTSNRHDCPY